LALVVATGAWRRAAGLAIDEARHIEAKSLDAFSDEDAQASQVWGRSALLQHDANPAPTAPALGFA
jgi:hypothetical protein